MSSTRPWQPRPAKRQAARSPERSAEHRAERPDRARWPLALAGLSLAGAGLSAYLWQAKVGATELVCGPMGDCVTVNASAFSEVMGVPVALLGMLMYLTLAAVLVTVWRRPDTIFANIGFALALAGALFSLYLTGVEAFVLGAYCVWCLTSWILITVIAWQWGRAMRRAA